MENTSKNFVLQLGALASLYASLTALVMVLFGIINIMFPDAAESYWQYEGNQESVRFGIAMLAVFFPTYLVLTRFVNQIRRREHGVYLTLTRWLIYLSLFVGSAILLGDLVAVLWSFLNGEITMRFVLKAIALLVVVSAAVKYYILDTRGYWTQHEQQSLIFGAASILLVLVSIVFGFVSIDAPNEVRERRLDQQQISDLQDMQWRIEEYYRTENAFPEALNDVYISSTLPEAPEDRDAYEYRVTSPAAYELCATFVRASTREDARDMSYAYPMGDPTIAKNSNWEHETGRYCFERVAPSELVR